MGPGPVNSESPPEVMAASAADEAAPSDSWKLKPDVARHTQGLVVTTFRHLPVASALLLTLPPDAGGAWLQALRAVVTISPATGSSKDPAAAAIAFTATGLEAMNLPEQALRTFSAPFREGMRQIDRQRRLGDVEDPRRGTVIPGGPLWSGNAVDGFLAPPERPKPTPVTVHAVLLLYAGNEAALAGQSRAVEALLAGHAVTIAHRHTLYLSDTQGKAATREHFGFVDGISQPIPQGEAVIPACGPEAQGERHWHGIPLGEVLLGHRNAHHEDAPGPVVAVTPSGLASASTHDGALSSDGAPQGFLNLGVNGSYLVMRELRQDVPAFWNSLDAAAMQAGQPQADAKWIAERIVGRTLDGQVLRPQGPMTETTEPPANNFGFATEDPHGFGCPLGAHIRRANPRDALPSRDGDPKDAPALLEATKAHRFLRRGRKFGPDIQDLRTPDEHLRGLMFMCLNSDLGRQFEFVQQSWMLNAGFATLSGETDPLLGPTGPMTIPARPLRHKLHLQTYVQMAGGDYFFLPSLPALDYLGGLRKKLPAAAGVPSTVAG